MREHGLAGARLPRDHVQPAPERQFGALDQQQVPDPEFGEHRPTSSTRARRCRGEGRISWAFVPTRTAFDVVVVGASISGCTAARLFALAGARVALVERRPDPDAYKVACTHAILSSAVPTMERIGLTALLDARGAVRTHPEVWTRTAG